MGEQKTVLNTEQAMFGAGCFWGVQSAFDALTGVLETQVGYAGGRRPNPSYEQVCSDATGHAEVVWLKFDPEKIDYATLVQQFFALHDPTQHNRQGPDIGSQYRSVIFTYGATQAQQAQAIKASLKLARPVVTQIEPAPQFWPAEEYHQKYLAKRGRGACHF
jgi:peptide-methionine (S)-S-oxide reductase